MNPHVQYILTAAQSIAALPSMIWDSKLPEPVIIRDVAVFVGIGALSNADKYELHQEPIASLITTCKSSRHPCWILLSSTQVTHSGCFDDSSIGTY